MNLLQRYRRLKECGVIALNKRNADYILPLNKRSLFPLVDDKILTKKLALGAGLKVPELYGLLNTQYELRRLDKVLEGRESFAIKPSRGSGGNGILVIQRKFGERYYKVDGSVYSLADIKYHCSKIISGMYSLGGLPDKAIIEACVEFDPVFSPISYQGVPDIRIIVFHGVPVMSMVRLPTKESDGKANLHQGALGVGVDIATGKPVRAVWKNEPITEHPDTLHSLIDFQVPYWDVLLYQASQSTELTGLGYVGVDMVLDKNLGPLILELNARPGLAIQIANFRGLEPRLQYVENNYKNLKTIEDKIAFAKRFFTYSAGNSYGMQSSKR